MKKFLNIKLLGVLFCVLPAYAQVKLAPLPLLTPCAQRASDAIADQAAQPFIAKLKDKDIALRVQAAEHLGKSCYQAAANPLVAALQDTAPQVRAAAITALGKLADRDTVEDLRMMTGDADTNVRLALIQALATFTSFSARNAVLNNIANPSDFEVVDENDARVRCVAILTLNDVSNVEYSRKGIYFVYGFLKSRHAAVREVAEQTMLALKDTRNAPTELIATLKTHNSPELRRWAAVWLGKLGIELGREALTNAATGDASPAVKDAAGKALAQFKAPAK
jgi:HEAT repeat protein